MPAPAPGLRLPMNAVARVRLLRLPLLSKIPSFPVLLLTLLLALWLTPLRGRGFALRRVRGNSRGRRILRLALLRLAWLGLAWLGLGAGLLQFALATAAAAAVAPWRRGLIRLRRVVVLTVRRREPSLHGRGRFVCHHAFMLPAELAFACNRFWSVGAGGSMNRSIGRCMNHLLLTAALGP